jgi:LuxR family transcriptional regulator, maltose regulon positive regulatory protein
LNDAIRRNMKLRALKLTVLKALSLDAVGDPTSVTEMSAALRTGLSTGFSRVFLEEGFPALDLMRRAEPLLFRDLPSAESAEFRQQFNCLLRHDKNKQVNPIVNVGQDGNVGGLTKREAEILAILEKGLTNREIADCFSLSERTVKWHLQNIFAKLGVGNRTEAAFLTRSTV